MSEDLIPCCGNCRYWNYDTDKLCLHHDHWLEERNPGDYCDKWEDGRKIRILDLLGYCKNCKKVEKGKERKVFWTNEIKKLEKELKELKNEQSI